MEVGRKERRQAEWDNARWRISMEINPESKVGELYAMDKESGEDSFQRVDLKGEKGWKTLCDSLERLGGGKSMNPTTRRLRQIPPAFVQNGRASSAAFRPTTKDVQRLSVYNGDKIEVPEAYKHFTSSLRCTSHGILFVTAEEFSGCP